MTINFNILLQVQKSETLKGCIQKLSVNGHPEDLVGESTLHHNVGQCFPSVERGSYFPGDAYVMYSEYSYYTYRV